MVNCHIFTQFYSQSMGMKKLALLLSLAVLPIYAQNLPTSKQEITLSFAPIVKKTRDSVVNVYGARVDKVSNPYANDPFWGRFFQNQPKEHVSRSLGSGVIVDNNGLIVTNNHVIEGMTEVKVSLADKREFEAEILLRDPRTDLAVLRIKNLKEKLNPLEIGDPDKLEVGDLVLALGNPFGVGQTVTQGIISALARSQVGVSDYQSFIQTDAAINPGNSGGALVDMAGRLVGINTAIFSKSGGSHGIGFAIPSTMVKVVLASANNGSLYVKRPWIGLKTESITSELAESLNLTRTAGVLVRGTVTNSPAAKAGLKAGDVITHLDSIQVDDPDSFGYRLAIKPVNSDTKLTYLRSGKPQMTTMTLAPAPEGVKDRLRLSGQSPLMGAEVQTTSPALEEELGIDVLDEGVVILNVSKESAAENVGFKKGDIITTINGEKITSPSQIDKITQSRPRRFQIEINRGGQVLRSSFAG